MTDQEPLEGFQITGYDEETKKVTIEVHPFILRHPKSVEKLTEIMIEALKKGSTVISVEIVPREIGKKS